MQPNLKVRFEDLPKTRTPILTYCRQLIERGESGRLEVYRGKRTEPDVVVRDIAAAAQMTVTENDRGGPYFAKFTLPGVGLAANHKNAPAPSPCTATHASELELSA
jgi:hypothetical protein